MSFISKIFSFKNKNTKKETTEKETAGASVEVCSPKAFARSEETDFECLLTDENFQGYTIERDVHVNRFDPSAHPACLPVSYLFVKDNTPV